MSQIIASDILEDNLRIAAKVGAHVTFNPSGVDVVKEIQKLLGDGADLHFFGGRSRRDDGYGVLLGCCIRKQLAGNYRGSEKQMTDKRGRDKKSSAGDHRGRTNAPPAFC